MNNTQRTAIIANLMESIQNQYNGEHDLFNDEIQVNVTDLRLLNIVSFQQAIIEELTARLARLEVFTGMVAPAPLPVDDSAPAELEDVLAMLSRDDRDEMATWLTEQIGESVQHHPIENLRIFMERQIHNLEAGL